ncbi:hypothetical protein CEUSTIGMA_g10179.t1 [Chlamydomonas eustigma]|uniref:HMG box domain-containing protein n=1 Tax=Chlamydomonas eustigma TaxID=1157962 RepID=A0A250XI82_9CHLO|nr:hypothetical protein CEUSTIGMA_g10179.t1 [Chlamydomonas eustigma]|eukprot:GAX82753.1 hypothetical protein CEUSTIGMA_g10179.t1 [Chlamydomonas eustigma]
MRQSQVATLGAIALTRFVWDKIRPVRGWVLPHTNKKISFNPLIDCGRILELFFAVAMTIPALWHFLSALFASVKQIIWNEGLSIHLHAITSQLMGSHMCDSNTSILNLTSATGHSDRTLLSLAYVLSFVAQGCVDVSGHRAVKGRPVNRPVERLYKSPTAWDVAWALARVGILLTWARMFYSSSQPCLYGECLVIPKALLSVWAFYFVGLILKISDYLIIMDKTLRFAGDLKQNKKAPQLHGNERGEDAKLSVADVAKEIGKKWKTLTDEQREEYKQKAQAAGDARVAEEASGDQAQQPNISGANSREESPLDSLLPLTAVRRIILADTDVCRVSHEGIVAVAMATNLLLGILAKGVGNQARVQKRKTVMLKDFSQALKQDRRLVQASLRDVETAVKEAAEKEVDLKAKEKEVDLKAKEKEGATNQKAELGAPGGELEGQDASDRDVHEDENADPAQPQAQCNVENMEKIQSRAPSADCKKSGSAASKAAVKKRKADIKVAVAGSRKINSFFVKNVQPSDPEQAF